MRQCSRRSLSFLVGPRPLFQSSLHAPRDEMGYDRSNRSLITRRNFPHAEHEAYNRVRLCNSPRESVIIALWAAMQTCRVNLSFKNSDAIFCCTGRAVVIGL